MREIKGWEKLSFFLFGIGFFTATWDRVAVWELGGFTLRLGQLCFLASFLAIWRFLGHRALLEQIRSRGKIGFYLFFCLIAAYFFMALPISKFPLKSILYTVWLVFNLVCVLFPASIWGARIPKEWLFILGIATLGFHSAVLLLDQVAFYYGFNGGWIGFNQDRDLKLGVSRPAAFSFEPSYIASFLAVGAVFFSGKLFDSSKLKLFILPVLALTLWGILISTSRTGFFSVIIGVIAIVCLETFRRKRVPLRFLGGAGAIFVLLAVLFVGTRPAVELEKFQKYFVSGLMDGTDGSQVTRMRAYFYAYQMAQQTNYLGTGIGASFRYWAKVHDYARYGEPVILRHNSNDIVPEQYGFEAILSTWGQLLAEGGPLVVALFFLAGFALSKQLWISFLLNKDSTSMSAFVAFSLLFFVILHWIGNINRADVWVWYAFFVACDARSEIGSTAAKI